jgi:hypothetical protein
MSLGEREPENIIEPKIHSTSPVETITLRGGNYVHISITSDGIICVSRKKDEKQEIEGRDYTAYHNLSIHQLSHDPIAIVNGQSFTTDSLIVQAQLNGFDCETGELSQTIFPLSHLDSAICGRSRRGGIFVVEKPDGIQEMGLFVVDPGDSENASLYFFRARTESQDWQDIHKVDPYASTINFFDQLSRMSLQRTGVTKLETEVSNVFEKALASGLVDSKQPARIALARAVLLSQARADDVSFLNQVLPDSIDEGIVDRVVELLSPKPIVVDQIVQHSYISRSMTSSHIQDVLFASQSQWEENDLSRGIGLKTDVGRRLYDKLHHSGVEIDTIYYEDDQTRLMMESHIKSIAGALRNAAAEPTTLVLDDLEALVNEVLNSNFSLKRGYFNFRYDSTSTVLDEDLEDPDLYFFSIEAEIRQVSTVLKMILSYIARRRVEILERKKLYLPR